LSRRGTGGPKYLSYYQFVSLVPGLIAGLIPRVCSRAGDIS
jgi:hypothetical protein